MLAPAPALCLLPLLPSVAARSTANVSIPYPLNLCGQRHLCAKFQPDYLAPRVVDVWKSFPI